MKSLNCTNKDCPLAVKAATGRVVRHGFYRTKWGRHRQYRCQACGKTFCTNTGTPYHQLQHHRATFANIAALSVEGLNKSAIARVEQIAWNTVDRWLERAANSCHRFNARRITGLAVEELRADEIRTIVAGKQQPIWIFAVIDVWSRLWPSTVVGRRSYRNTFALFRDVANRMNLARFPVIATDGATGSAPRAAALLLQLREASPGAEIRRRGQDTGHPGGSDEAATDVKGDLLIDDLFAGMGEGQVRVRLLHDLGHCGRSASATGGVATLDDGSTHCRLRRWSAWDGSRQGLPSRW